ncbi:TIR domain-containing protein [Saccharicrinis sp. FJH62]|uniref:TIR domain-containing protein n=1 Tax=Saccharicrinis sp. FJH62 TaxID=3344657 RepID=UPI0035D46CB4
MNQNINIFIGSSVEGLELAHKIQEKLDYDGYSVWIWEDVYNLSTQTLERLEEIKDQYHFGIFILSADDLVMKRNEIQWSARDNVLLELGFFMGFIGRKRCFIVMPRNIDITIPSDISGLTLATYDPKKQLTSAIGPAINKIRESIKELLLNSDLNMPIHYYNFRNIDSYTEEISKSTNRIFILSLRTRGFIEDHKSDNGERLLNALKNGTKIRILLFDPYIELKDSKYLPTKTGEILSIFSGDGKSQESWHESLTRTLDFVNFIETKGTEMKYSGSIEVKFHCSPIITMLFFIDNNLYFGPYLLNSDHIKSPTFKINLQHQLFNRYLNHFNDLWNESRLTREIY